MRLFHTAPRAASAALAHRVEGTRALDFDELYRLYSARVWRWAQRLGASPTDVPEVVQEVFLTALRRLPAYRPEIEPATWLFGITRKEVYDRRRRDRRRQLADQLEPFSDVDDRPNPDEHLRNRQALDRVYRALDGLRERERTAIILHHLEEIPGREAAALMGISLGAFWDLLRRARLRFGKRLKAQLEDLPELPPRRKGGP